MSPENSYLIFFDGHCILCHFWVRQVLKYDRKKIFYFADLEGPMAKRFLEDRNLSSTDSIVLWKKGEAYWLRSDAVFLIAKELNGIFYWLALFRFLPTFITDAVYLLIARQRRRWFGSFAACPPPPIGFMERFLS